MLPYPFLFGLVLGRWPVGALAATAVWWVQLRIDDQVPDPTGGDLAVNIGLTLANVLIGIAIHRWGLLLVRTLRRRRAATSPAQ